MIEDTHIVMPEWCYRASSVSSPFLQWIPDIAPRLWNDEVSARPELCFGARTLSCPNGVNVFQFNDKLVDIEPGDKGECQMAKVAGTFGLLCFQNNETSFKNT